MTTTRLEAALTTWHRVVDGDLSALDELLADDCVFWSPVVHTPQRGKAITTQYLAGAMHVLGAGGFRYVKEVVAGSTAVLEFETVVDGLTVNGVDIITVDDAGLVVEFKVMLRPLKAVNVVHARMGEMLAALKG